MPPPRKLPVTARAIEAEQRRRALEPVPEPVVEEPVIPRRGELLTAEQAKKQYDVDLEPGWQLRLRTDPQIGTQAFYVSPEGWEVDEHGGVRSPEGKYWTAWEYEQELLGPQLTPTEQLERESLERTLGQVFPEEDIGTLFQQMAVIPDMPPEDTARAEQAQDEFLGAIQAQGRTPNTEYILKQLGATEEQIGEFFPEPTWEEAKWWAEEYAGASLGEKAVKQFTAGVGDLFSSSGGVARRFGYEDVGAILSGIATNLQKHVPPREAHDFEFADVLSPEFYAEEITRTIPFALSLAPMWIGGFYAGSAIGAAVGLGRIGSYIVGAFTGAALSRPAESLLEAGSQYDDAIARGKTEKEAQEEFDQVFSDNMKLVGLDAFEIAVMMAPTPKWVPLRLVSLGLVRTVRIGGKMVIVGLSEGGEEVYQDMVQRRARGEEWKWDPISKEVFAIGAIMGMGMGLGGDVVQSVVNRSKDTMPPSIKSEFDASVADFKAEGFMPDQAELRALDVIAETPEGQKVVSDAIEEVKKEIPAVPEAVPEATLSLEEISKYETRIPLDLIRKDEKASLERLTTEIEKEGITEPITIRVREDGSRIVWDGMHRLIVAQNLGIKNVPVKFIGEKVAIPEVVTEIIPISEFVPANIREDIYGKAWDANIWISRKRALVARAGLSEDVSTKIWKQLTEVEKEALFTQAREEVDLPTAWDSVMTVRERTILAEAMGFKRIEGIPPKVVGKEWAELSLEEQQRLSEVTPEVAPPVVKVPPPIEVAPERVVYTEGGVPISPDEPISAEMAENIPMAKDIGILERWIRPTRKVFERMGLYETYKGIQRAEVEIGEARVAFDKGLKEVSGWVANDRRAIVFRELENPGSQVGLTFNEKRAISFFRDHFNKWAETLNLPAEKRVKNYVTHIFEADIAEQLKTKYPLDPAIARALEYKAPTTIFNPFLQKRLGATTGLVEDPFAAVSAYESRQLKVLYYEPLLKNIAAVANAKTTPPIMRDYLRDFSRRMTGQPNKIDIAINNTLRDFAGVIAKLPGGERLAGFLTRGNPSGFAAYNFTSALYGLWLGFKATSAIRNLSQHTLILAEVGPVHFADGARLRLTQEGKAALKESLVWRSRRAAFVPGIDDSFQQRWTDKFRESALWMFRKADAQNVMDAYLAGYSEAKSLFPEADRQLWIDRGDEVAADTQYLYTKMNSMALSQSAPGRVFSVLTTWSINWVELMTKWVKQRPSQVYLQYTKETGQAMPKKNWSQSYKSIIMYMVIVGLGYVLKEKTRLRAWEYTGLTSIRYLADVAGGDFPGLEGPGAIANVIAGFLTDDDRRLKTGWNQLKGTFTPGIVRQLENVAAGEKDWLTLLLYLEGLDWEIKQLKSKWEKGWEEYEALETQKERDKYREDNPLIEAQMFVTSKFTTLTTEEARAEVLRIIEKNKLDTELIDGYEKVFGVDTDEKFTSFKKTLGTVELDEEGRQKVKENGELDYFTTSNFASEVNKLEKVVGRYKIEKDGNALAIEYLRARDLFVQYESLTTDEARALYRQQFPDVEAQLYLWGKIASFKNPKSAEILLGLMDKYNIPPESVPAFLDNPERYDELFTQKFELKQKWFDLTTEYENYGNEESPLYVEDEEARKEARDKLKNDNPSWMADIRRIEAIDHDAPDEIIESWAERGKTIDEFGAGSSEAKVWLIDHKETWDWALEQKLLTDDGADWNEPVLRLNAEMATMREGSDQYNLLKRKKDAYTAGFSETQIDNYVTYYELSVEGYRQERFLIENPDFAKSMNEIKGIDIPEKVPSVEYDILLEKEDKTPEDERRMEAYKLYFPDKLVDDYVEYYSLERAGYEDDWFLMEHTAFYKAAKDLLGWEPRDFSKVPSREVYKYYLIYTGLPLGQIRLDYRAQHSELEEWLVDIKGYTPIEDRGDEEVDISQAEQLAIDIAEGLERIEALK